MKGCRQIESLLYLYRDDELTQAEAMEVRTHLDGCPGCSGVLRGLRELGDALRVARTTGDVPTAGLVIVERTMDRIRKTSRRGNRTTIRPEPSVPLFGAVRPAIGFVLLCAALLLSYQQGRDLHRMAMMEDRLADRASGAGQDRISMAQRATLLIEALTPGPNKRTADPLSGASAFPDLLLQEAGPGMRQFVGGRDDLFREYSEKYPALTKVNPYDGLDEWEKVVLSTEGKEFLKEFRQLILEGDHQS